MGLENPTHWIPIIVVLLLVFGARRLPEIGRSLGEGMRGFKESVTGQGDHKESLNAGPAQQQPAPTPQSQQAAAPQAPASPEPPAAAG
jgi:sec-independent protein translocase protein TatA